VKIVGLHIRLTGTIFDVAQKAYAFKMPLFQCFFIHQETNTFIQLTEQEIALFLKEWRPLFKNIYLHGSYWINLASEFSGNKILLREIELAKKLAFTHIVLHCGAAKRVKDKSSALALIAKKLNKITKTENDMVIVLENSAHGGRSLGGDFHDFSFIKERLDQPEKIQFCLDTAHAYSYGYDIVDSQKRQDFLQLVDKTVGFANIALIHLNDTQQICGSLIDRHENPGTGLLADALPGIIDYPPLANVPIILELPVMNEQEELQILDRVRSW
jgi:deoxyribonuclease-4